VRWNYDTLSLSVFSLEAWEMVIAQPEQDWNWCTLSYNLQNCFLSDDEIERIWMHPRIQHQWWRDIVITRLRADFVLRHPEYHDMIDRVTKFHPEIIARPDLPWNWNALSTFVELKHFLTYSEAPWQAEGLSNNVNIPLKILHGKTFLDWQMASHRVSSSPEDIAFFLDNTHRPWTWSIVTLGLYQADRLDVLVENPEFPWRWPVGNC